MEFAKSVQQLRPDLKIFVYNEFTYAFEKAIENGFYGITVDMDQVSATDVLKAHENNLRVALFGPDSKSKNIEAIKMQPDYIQSDALKHLDRILN